MSSSRDRLAEIITPMLPDDWRRIERHTVRAIGTLSAPTVFIDFMTMSHAGMPAGSLVDGFEVTLVSHLTDYAKAEDEIDEAAKHLVKHLDPSGRVAWSTARKASFGDYLGWTIDVQLLNTI